MRLVCPNCEAQYEVEARLIPDEGRDVQCSSCGDTWFQKSQAMLDEEAAEAQADTTEIAEDSPAEAHENIAEIDGIIEDEPADAAEDDATADIDESFFDKSPSSAEETALEDDEVANFYEEVGEEEPTEPDEEASASAELERPELDAAVLDVLRQEAELETRAREEEGTANLDIQTDMGLEEQEAPAERDVAEAIASLPEIEAAEPADDVAASRSGLLPDIDEINSTLRAESDRKTTETADSDEEAANRSGFNYGFSIVIMLVGILFGVYVLAPQLGQSVPAIDGTLKVYVRTVDAGRVQLDQAMEAVIRKLKEEPEVTLGAEPEADSSAENTEATESSDAAPATE
ncbi:zinc-ribbon domain-containing protein [Halocynthiibacter sp. C4]|uniref:zinc-ribbon domain-containing protein n=1 Tax=Halocynthiibacter sp. C4 TaxID=2992758 RepID=UPI00237A5B0F|nr:zinc-ribbon domain-containing protein [Halocynthiibacter sp. C4]MDE0590738.1 zinc-ribbon domain-containing protein [Halocynthiibacter sp. C4]